MAGKLLAAVVCVLLVVLGTEQLVDVAAQVAVTERSEHEGVDRIVVEDASDVTLTSAPAGTPLRVVARVTKGLSAPDRREDREGATLRLDSSCPLIFADSCAVDYELAIPPDVEVRIDARGGDVEALGLRSERAIVLHSSAGDVDADGIVAPELRATSSAGDVALIDVEAERITARTTAGDVHVEAGTPFDALSATSTAGDASVLVPDDVYALDARTTAGDVDARSLRTDPDAPRRLTVTSTAGDVRVEVHTRR